MNIGKFGGFVLTIGEDIFTICVALIQKITIIDGFAKPNVVFWTAWTDQTLIPIMPAMFRMHMSN